MAIEWPGDLGYGTITGQICYLDGDSGDAGPDPDMIAAEGTVLVTPLVQLVKYSGVLGSRTLVPRKISGKLDTNGYIVDGNGNRGIAVPATDSDKINPTGWGYSVSIAISGGGTISFTTPVTSNETVDVTTAVTLPTAGQVTVIDSVVAMEAKQASEASAESAQAAAASAQSAADSLAQAEADIQAGLIKGDKGDKGEDAVNPNFSIAASTLTAGSQATAKLSGAYPNLAIGLGIPAGATGSPSATQIIGAGRPDVASSMDANTQELVAAAPVGTSFNSTDGASVGAWTWRKRPSGWDVTDGDTGWRNITGSVEWVGVDAAGTFNLRRVNNLIHVRWAGVTVAKATSGFNTVTVCRWSFPGFEIMDGTSGYPFHLSGVAAGYSIYGLGENLNYLGFMRENAKVHVRAYGPPLDTRRSGYHQWPNFSVWPKTLPGTAA